MMTDVSEKKQVSISNRSSIHIMNINKLHNKTETRCFSFVSSEIIAVLCLCRSGSFVGCILWVPSREATLAGLWTTATVIHAKHACGCVSQQLYKTLHPVKQQ